MFDAKFTWNGPAVVTEIKAASWERIVRVVVFFHTEVLAVLNKSNPRPYVTPSLPGEPPRKRTGWLQRNVRYELAKGKQVGRIGITPNAKYGLYLEIGTKRMKPRPWLLATLTRLLPQLRAMAEKG
jgi:hypothetical protein